MLAVIITSSADPLAPHCPRLLPATFPLNVPNVLFSFFALVRSGAITTHDDLFQTTSSREAEFCSFPVFPTSGVGTCPSQTNMMLTLWNFSLDQVAEMSGCWFAQWLGPDEIAPCLVLTTLGLKSI